MKHSGVFIVVCLLLFRWYQRLWLESLEHRNTSFKSITIPSATTLQILVIRLFVKQIVEAKTKGNIKAPHYWPFAREIYRSRTFSPIPSEKARNAERNPMTRWRHEMETFSGLLAFRAGNSLVVGKFPSQRPVTRSFDIFFDLHLNKRLSKQPGRCWFETPSVTPMPWRYLLSKSHAMNIMLHWVFAKMHLYSIPIHTILCILGVHEYVYNTRLCVYLKVNYWLSGLYFHCISCGYSALTIYVHWPSDFYFNQLF